MSRLTVYLAVIVAVLFIAGCNAGGGTIVDAPPDLSIGMGQDEQDLNLIKIEENMVGEEFLLQASFSEQAFGANPTSSGMKSRIVIFEEQGDELLMLEATDGYQPGEELSSHKLLAVFPIKKRDDGKIIFDFNKGMKNFFYSDDWHGSDFGGNSILSDVAYSADSSYVREVEEKIDSITIVQEFSIRSYVYLLPIEVTYYLTRYRPNPNYVPVASPGFAYLGYFEANPRVQKEFGVPFAHITRWDITKPVTYYVSTAIPEEYRQAAIEGILYWNKVFGAEVLRAEVAPEGVTAPDFEHNIIQWHTDQSYRGAYADAQMDPRTGEILHAQVFLGSGIINWARAILPIERQLEDGGMEDGKGNENGTDRFRGTRLCELNLQEMLGGLYRHREIIESVSPGRIEDLTEDLIRTIVAHEVGHTLGLRHNFAASMVNELSGEEEDEMLKNFIKTGNLPDIEEPINSIMEYANMAADLIVGAYINDEDTPPLAHDQYAIQWGYYGYNERPKYKGLPFCTDSHTWTYTDCVRWDGGKHLLERNGYEINSALEHIPNLLSEAYLDAKTNPNPSLRRPVKESTPSAGRLAGSVGGVLWELMRLMGSDLNLVSILLNYTDLIDIDMDYIDEETMSWLNFEIAYAGGVEKLLRFADPDYYKRVVQGFEGDFDRIVKSNTFKNADLPEGGKTGFTQKELDYMMTRARELFPEVDEQVAMTITMALGSTSFTIIDAIEKIEDASARWAEYVILADIPEDYPSRSAGPVDLKFRYTIDTRRSAVNLMTTGGPLPGWLVDSVPPVAEKLREKLETGFGMPIENVKPEQYPRAERGHISDELNLYYSLANYGAYLPIYDDDPDVPGDPIPLNSKQPAGAVKWIQSLM